jgi:hypothetical protein
MPILDSPVSILAGIHGDSNKMKDLFLRYRHLNFIRIDEFHGN